MKYEIVFKNSGIFTVAYLHIDGDDVCWGTGFDKEEAVKALRARRKKVLKQAKEFSVSYDDVIQEVFQ